LEHVVRVLLDCVPWQRFERYWRVFITMYSRSSTSLPPATRMTDTIE
jgi:hypothetical protein